MGEVKLEFIGKDKQFIIGVPTRDLAESDIKASGYTKEQLIDSGLYREITPLTATEEV